MNKPCKTCKGKGRWLQATKLDDETDFMQWHECNDCKGTGIEPDPDDEDVFDIGGAEDDY